jgi:RimJ/RimL family protein N-acetyltransferase
MPDIRILQPGDEATLEAYLLPRLESSMFLIGNQRASGLVDHGQPYQGTYAAAFEGQCITAIVAHFWNGVLIFQAPSHLDELWRAAVDASRREIKGLIGPADQVAAARAALDIDAAGVQMDQREKLYALDFAEMVVPDTLRSGIVCGRRIEPRDLDLVTEWSVAYSIEALGEQDSSQLRDDCHASVRRSMEEGHTWLLEVAGTPVASTSFNTAIREAVQVGGVWTPPPFRRRGYARCAVAASLLDAQAEGAEKAILFTGQENIAAQKAYTALGFRHIGYYRIILIH